ncbi:DUF3137 domain-containing protein [Campylobacter sp.]|uniref:DUF3137 domain-containing protein n=1 Tax=Campylobacter sp. TaxID=205 RepID=UPI0027BA0BB1|nr:DUF3137 domain-containing protein [Campylobacter sp.]
MSPSLQDAISQTLIEQKACARVFNRYYYLSIAAFFAVLFVLVFLDGVKADTPSIEIAEFLGALIFFPIFWIFLMHCASQESEAEIRYYKFYKEIFVRAVINDIDAGLKYDPYTGMQEEEFQKFRIYRKSKIKSEDRITGAHCGIKFSLSEVHSNGRFYMGTDNPLMAAIMLIKIFYDNYMDFDGNVLICELAKKTSGKTIVVSRELNAKIFGEKEMMDDVDFMRDFRVFADDKVEARYLLTPAFMERLLEINRETSGEFDLSAVFMDERLYLFLKGAPDLFETTLFDRPASIELAREYQTQIRKILSLIETLKLTN